MTSDGTMTSEFDDAGTVEVRESGSEDWDDLADSSTGAVDTHLAELPGLLGFDD